MKTIFTVVTITMFVAQLLSVFIVFKKVPSTDNIRYRTFQIQFLVAWSYFFSLLYKKTNSSFYISSAILISVCLSLFLWCSYLIKNNKLTIVFSADSPNFHINRGPYAVIRHPFYSSYIFTYAALALVAQSWIFSLLCISLFFTYYSAAKYEEQKFLSSKLRESYESYMHSTGMFFPRLVRTSIKSETQESSSSNLGPEVEKDTTSA